jgi:thymidine kinase
MKNQYHNIKMDVGFLEIILGPMFSGKTTHLVDLYNAYNINGISVLAINYSADKRYHDTMLSTHDKNMIPCIFADKITDLLDELLIVDTILINEGQFFPDLYESVEQLVNKHNKRVHVCGLDGDFQRNKFGNMLDLIPLCDSVTKLQSKCHTCSKLAIFSHRITKETEQVVIGSTNYVPLCRNCYHKYNKPTNP